MYSIDNRLRPTIEFLTDTVQCTEERVKRICTSYPNVFSHSLEKTLAPKIAFFKRLGLNRSEISQVVAKFAPTLWLSEENLSSKLDFLSKSLGMKTFELRTVVLTYPQILGLSVENNVTPKIQFFLDPEEYDGDSIDALQRNDSNFVNCGLRKSELKDFVLYQPALLAYSLEGRLKPRIARMQDYNISFLYSPRNIMSYTDDKFAAWLSSQTSSWSIIN
jgi:mTERF domain-containing protein